MYFFLNVYDSFVFSAVLLLFRQYRDKSITNTNNLYLYLRLSLCQFLIGSDLLEIHNSLINFHNILKLILRPTVATSDTVYPLVFDWIANLSSIISRSRRGIETGWRKRTDDREGEGSGEERIRRREKGKGGPCVSKGFRVFRITSCSAPELVCRDPRVTPLYWHIVERDPNTCDIIPNCEQSCRRGDLLVKSPMNRKQIIRVRRIPRILS